MTKREINLKISTKDNPIDITKALPMPKFKHYLKILEVVKDN